MGSYRRRRRGPRRDRCRVGRSSDAITVTGVPPCTIIVSQARNRGDNEHRYGTSTDWRGFMRTSRREPDTGSGIVGAGPPAGDVPSSIAGSHRAIISGHSRQSIWLVCDNRPQTIKKFSHEGHGPAVQFCASRHVGIYRNGCRFALWHERCGKRGDGHSRIGGARSLLVTYCYTRRLWRISPPAKESVLQGLPDSVVTAAVWGSIRFRCSAP